MPRTEASNISVSRRGSPRGDTYCTVMWVGGEQDLATEDSLTVAIASAAQRDDLPLLVDLSAVTFMDASTVGAIVGSRNRLGARGQSLELRAPSAPALRVLELCGLTGLIRRDPVPATGTPAAPRAWVDVDRSRGSITRPRGPRRAQRRASLPDRLPPTPTSTKHP